VRFATADEASLETFLSASEESPYQGQLREYAKTLLQRGSTRLEWCLVGLDDGIPAARAALWALPGQAVPTDIVLIAADWEDDELSGGHELLPEVHELARSLGAKALSHHVDSPPGPPQWQESEDARIRLLVESGYELLRDGLRWMYSGSPVPRQQSLVYRALPDVGEDAFVEAIASTYEGTRDSWINQTVDEHGAIGAARADFDDYRQMEHLPEWWELAYTADGELAGVIMAARNPTTAVIAYVGVVPDHRGRGLAPELVQRGTEQLVASGSTEIGGDCDRDNVGMVKAFRRAGFEEAARRHSYRRDLS
jgi:ribosomal protein S18 acetylase RimI-like enzyme